MLAQTLKRALSGFVLGMAVGNLIAALTGHPDIVSPALLERAGSLSAALLWQTILSGVIGAAGFGGMVLYEIERWPLRLTDAVHNALVLAVFLPCALVLGWINTAAEVLIMAGIMSAAHYVVFLIMCARYRAQVRELNELNELRKARIHQQQSIGGAI